MFIWFIMAIVLIVIAVGGYGGRRAYRNRQGGGAGDNPSSHRGHASKSGGGHRGRGKGH